MIIVISNQIVLLCRPAKTRDRKVLTPRNQRNNMPILKNLSVKVQYKPDPLARFGAELDDLPTQSKRDSRYVSII